MKRIFAALVAVMCMTGMTLVATAGTSSAQAGCNGSYVACPPVTSTGGTVTIDTDLPEGTVVTVNTLDAMGNVIGTQMVTAGANGVITLNVGAAAALAYTNAAGATVTNSVVAAAAPVAPAAPAPAPVLASNGPHVTTTTASI